jgi:hypothetical protein
MSSPMTAPPEPPAVAPAAPLAGRAARPPLRLLHHMARSGGTLISKCLGCMSGVVLLSEIHPLGTNHFNPLIQAQRWYGLLSAQDLIDLRGRRIGFADAIELIRRRADDCGQRLVIRDWSHLDFTGVPFVAKPAHRLLTAEALASRYELRQVCTVRHPLDQWLSLSRLAVVQGRLELATFLAGYRRFAETAQAIGFQRYEDFTRDPTTGMRALCTSLQLKFDRHFSKRWREYTHVTGDISGSRGGGEIGPAPRHPVAADLLARLAANDDYQTSLRILGYDHPEA